jgi:hypothetical protein
MNRMAMELKQLFAEANVAFGLKIYLDIIAS